MLTLCQPSAKLAGMRILAIETSCDETAVSLVEADGAFPDATYTLLGDALASQVETHRQYGGVFPALAKREHAQALVPLLAAVLSDAGAITGATTEMSAATTATVHELLAREEGLADALTAYHSEHGTPEIDRIAVTVGPGLEPALWVGISFAKALAVLWDTPVVPVHHMEGHILAAVFDHERDDALAAIGFPALALLISGGHTEFIHLETWGRYDCIGHTRDDAVGEAYDKVARLMGLPYPGGPEVAARAKRARRETLPSFTELTPPMLNSGDLDLSFSGLKTAVRYAVGEQQLSKDEVAALCRDFEDAVVTVLIKKTRAALTQTGAATLIVGGGVSANEHLRTQLTSALMDTHPHITAYFPHRTLATDNSLMIALAGHAHADSALAPRGAIELLRADGNRPLS